MSEVNVDKGGYVEPRDDCTHIQYNFSWPIEMLEDAIKHKTCCKCNSFKEEWICLDCCEVNCSRYVNGHAEEHYLENLGNEATFHCVALSRSDLSFWCYNCGSYIISPELQILRKKAEEFKHGKNHDKLDVIGEEDDEEDEDEEEEVEKEDDEDELIEDIDIYSDDEDEKLIEAIDFAMNVLDIDKEIDEQVIFDEEKSRKKLEPSIAFFWHPDCERHCMSHSHPEQPARVTAILEQLRNEYHGDHFRIAPKVTDEQILLFHTNRHLETFKRLCTTAENGKEMRNRFIPYDSDTVVMPHTRDAAYRAAGAVIAAVDAIYLPDEDSRKVRTAFCPVRPPGHHAEPNKVCGFCFLANAGIAARYAQTKYDVERVAVLDFDVHHGNGTEEGFKHFDTLFYGSTHEKDNFPGTGIDPTPFIGERAKRPIDRRIVDRTIAAGPTSRAQFKVKWRQIIEEMIIFKPNLIIFSAGFDAHDDDPLASLELIEEDFEWATQIVLEACVKIDPNSPIPCISVLEGGYDLNAIAKSASIHCKVLADGYPLPVKGEAALAIDHLKSLGVFE